MGYTVGIREFRQQASAVLRRVKAGEVVEVTEHGHPIARLVPMRSGALEQMVTDGRATPSEGDLIAMLEELSLPVEAPGRCFASQALEELRAE